MVAEKRPGDARAGGEKKPRVCDTESVREQARQFELVRAKMPLDALTTGWSLGTNRFISMRHKRFLRREFQRGIERGEEKNYLLVKADAKDVEQMMTRAGASEQDANGVHDFTDWSLVNEGRKGEIINGQHRWETLDELLREDATEERWWICVIYDKKRLPNELSVQLQYNRSAAEKEDSAGDKWMQMEAAAAMDPTGLSSSRTSKELQESFRILVRLRSNAEIRRPVTVFRNERWRRKTTAFCGSAVGRALFNASRWDLMIRSRMDDFWFHALDHLGWTLERLPANAKQKLMPEDWKQLADAVGTGQRTQHSVKRLFYPACQGDEPVSTSARQRRFLEAYSNDEYLATYQCIENSEMQFWDLHGLLGLSGRRMRVLEGAVKHVVAWLNREPTRIVDQRSNTKPAHCRDMVAGMRSFDAEGVARARKRLQVWLPWSESEEQRNPMENACIVLQQEILEFVLAKYDEFREGNNKAWMELGVGADEAGYSERFRSQPWAGLLAIVRWYGKENFRPDWQDADAEGQTGAKATGAKAARRIQPSSNGMMGDAMQLSRIICDAGRQLQGSSYEPLKRRLETEEFRAKLAEWLSRQCEGELAYVNTYYASPDRNVAETGCNGGQPVVIDSDSVSNMSDWSEQEAPPSAQRPAVYHSTPDRTSTEQADTSPRLNRYENADPSPARSSDEEQPQPTVRRQATVRASPPASLPGPFPSRPRASWRNGKKARDA